MTTLFDRCVLHIGTEKTGTTSLQAFLGANRAALAGRGFYVPKTLSPYKILANHERLTSFALATSKLSDDVRRAAGVRSEADIPVHRQRVRSELRAEFSRLDTSRTTLILSNEHCHSRLTSEDEVRTLFDLLVEFASTIEVVVYLRPQHELAASLYDQALKAGYADIDVLPDFGGSGQRWVEREYFDYDALTTRWANVFGATHISPRIFARSRLVNGSIIDDFLSHLPCDLSGLEKAQDRNTSVSAALQPALNALNRYGRSHPERLPGNTRQQVITLLQKMSKGGGRRPSKSAAEAFFQQFALPNERVRARFFPDRPSLFDAHFDDYPDRAMPQPPEADALAEVILSILTTAPP